MTDPGAPAARPAIWREHAIAVLEDWLRRNTDFGVDQRFPLWGDDHAPYTTATRAEVRSAITALRAGADDRAPAQQLEKEEEKNAATRGGTREMLGVLQSSASQNEVVSMPAPEKTAWLVGLGSMPPQWWTGRGDEWTTDVNGTQRNPAKCAIQFARREDAERAIGWLVKDGTRDGCRAEEHIWL